MSFQYVPGLIRTPEIPGVTPPAGVWRGLGSDAGYFAFAGSDSWGYHIMVKEDHFAPSLVVDGRTFNPVFTDINGYIYWSGNGYIYYSLDWGWVLCSMFPGYEPIETSAYDSDKGETIYSGDNFYVINSIPYMEGRTSRLTPRGKLRNKEVKTLEAVWDRWVGDTEFGEYKAKGNASGTRVMGLPRFRGNGEYFLRSLNKERGYFTYGRIHYSSGKWVIGEIGSANGWHEGSEPKVGSTVTFKFCAPEGSDVKGTNISVGFDSYVMGEETDIAYLGEVAIWR